MTEHVQPKFKCFQHSPDYSVIIIIIHLHLMMVGCLVKNSLPPLSDTSHSLLSFYTFFHTFNAQSLYFIPSHFMLLNQSVFHLCNIYPYYCTLNFNSFCHSVLPSKVIYCTGLRLQHLFIFFIVHKNFILAHFYAFRSLQDHVHVHVQCVTLCHMSEDNNMNTDSCENLISHHIIFSCNISFLTLTNSKQYL